jgi:hypothetical protein
MLVSQDPSLQLQLSFLFARAGVWPHRWLFKSLRFFSEEGLEIRDCHFDLSYRDCSNTLCELLQHHSAQIPCHLQCCVVLFSVVEQHTYIINYCLDLARPDCCGPDQTKGAFETGEFCHQDVLQEFLKIRPEDSFEIGRRTPRRWPTP